jgi:hypothetical protein
LKPQPPADKPPALQSNLLSLPPELFLHLTTFLPFNALLSLRSTCHPLYDLLSPSLLLAHRHTTMSQLLRSERSFLSDYRSSYPRQPYSHLWHLFYAAFEWQLQERPAKELTCYGCLEIKPLHCFVERMSSRGTGLGGKLATHRRCKDCMRRFYNVGGTWWREHWVRKSEQRKRRTRLERVGRWVTRGDSLVENVERGQEVGVCASCEGRQSELWWGCVGCFEKEERRKRREEWDFLLAEIDDQETGKGDTGGWARWLLERSEDWRSKRERERRRRNTRRYERGRWWKRIWRCASTRSVLRWEGSWEGRVEALVELLHGTSKDHESASDEKSVVDVSLDAKGKKSAEWKPFDRVPLAKDRREARCSMCWVPTCRRKTFMLGLAYETNLPFERWCAQCQREQVERQRKRRWRKEGMSTSRGLGSSLPDIPDENNEEEQEEEEGEVLEGMQRLFVS